MMAKSQVDSAISQAVNGIVAKLPVQFNERSHFVVTVHELEKKVTQTHQEFKLA